MEVYKSVITQIMTTKNNIEGILNNLGAFMDKRSYQDLCVRYKELIKDIPRNEILTHEDKTLPNFTNDAKYTGLLSELTSFEKEVLKYDDFKSLYDTLNEMENSSDKFLSGSITIGEYSYNGRLFIDELLSVKEHPYSKQFTDLIDRCIKSIYKTIKVLAASDDTSLIDYIQNNDLDYLMEALGSEIRKTIDVTNYKGSLSEDFVRGNILKQCASEDQYILSKKEEIEFAKRESQRLENERLERLASIENKLVSIENEIKSNSETAKDLKKKNRILDFKLLMIRFVIVPALALPLSMPFIGRSIGSNKAKEHLLTKTITQTTDMNTKSLLSHEETYETALTNYVASVTICEPWKSNISGNSYKRKCVVCDYNMLGLPDDFRLTIDNIDYDRLFVKYEYEETTSTPELRYLEEKQLLVTETYQLDEKIPDESYTTRGTIVGSVAALGTSVVEGFIYYNLAENIAYLSSEIKDSFRNNSNHMNTLDIDRKDLDRKKKELEEKKRKLIK